MSVTSSVGSAQINNGFSGQFYFPYSIGLLQAYFLKHSNNPRRYCFTPTIYKRIPLSEIVNQLVGRDVVLFSVYVWNINISIEVARELKLRNHEVFIIFGGPSVPDSAKEFLLSNNCIDVACHQEGERTLTSILDKFPNLSWQDTPGISYIDNKGEFQTNVGLPRMKDVSEIPSPYLEKIFDPLIKENQTEKWLASWETNRGCPFHCTFCADGKDEVNQVNSFSTERVKEELDYIVKHKHGNTRNMIFSLSLIHI